MEVDWNDPALAPTILLRRPCPARSHGTLKQDGVQYFWKAYERSEVERLQMRIDLAGTISTAESFRHRSLLSAVGPVTSLETPAATASVGLRQNAVVMVYPWCPLGDIFSVVQRKQLTFGMCVRVVRDVAGAVRHLHEQGVAHCDIKLENILLRRQEDDTLTAVLVDYELATPLEMRIRKHGSPSYMPLEVRAGLSGAPGPVDIFLLGVLLYELCLGVAVGMDEEWRQVAVARRRWDEFFRHFTSKQLEVRMPPLARNFFQQCCDPEPSRRPDIHTLLGHEMFLSSADDEEWGKIIM